MSNPQTPSRNQPDNEYEGELDKLVDTLVDAMIKSVRTGYVVHPTENVISPYHGKFQLKKAAKRLTQREVLKGRIAGLRRAFKLIDGTGVWDTKTKRELLMIVSEEEAQHAALEGEDAS